MHTQVAIIGAGPAGLALAHLLHRHGIESVVLEHRDQGYVEGRVRAGVLEQGMVDLLDELGLADRLRREGLVLTDGPPGTEGTARSPINDGPIFERAILHFRSFVVEPMQYRRLFLAGDAAHTVPPTGAKGMNLAIAEVRVLGAALAARYHEGRDDLLQAYSATCLRRVWRAEHFSWYMTSMLHRFGEDDGGFQHQMQLTQLRYTVSSRAAAASLAENYVGIAPV